jgi:hypothetical protein
LLAFFMLGGGAAAYLYARLFPVFKEGATGNGVPVSLTPRTGFCAIVGIFAGLEK